MLESASAGAGAFPQAKPYGAHVCVASLVAIPVTNENTKTDPSRCPLHTPFPSGLAQSDTT